ncbi:MAG: HIT family protein [Candidatus Pacebacteria bacterium]|nr:HIT family protein [Candidatus Paceibacterota bacterium]
MENCIFCKIIKGEIPCYKIYEDDLVLAFLDVSPMSIGHVLIIPKEHRENIFDVKEKHLERMIDVAKKIAQKMKDNMGAEGINLYHASGACAEQTVFHFHLHIVPREKDDNICFSGVAPQRKDISKEEFDAIVSKLKIG